MARTSRKNTLSLQKRPLSEDKMRFWKSAFYVRLSVEDNGKDSDSIENQIAILEKYVSTHPYLKKIALFVDNGYTGTDFLRPEFSRMMESVQRGEIDCIIVKDLSRLGRNYIETSAFVEKICPFYGIRFISVNDGYDTAALTNDEQLSASLSNIVNDYYAKDISRKVSSALRTKMEQGDYIGNYAPYGYQKDPHNNNRLIICPQTAPVIQQIFAWRAEGMSYSGINRKLNENGIASPGQWRFDHGILTNNNQKKSKILWNKHVLKKILHDIVYIGHTAQRKASQSLYEGLPFRVTDQEEWIVVKNTHEPLIDTDLFEKVQEINRQVEQNSKSNSGKYDHLPKGVNLYGKKFTCGRCGRVMKLHRSFNHRRDKVYLTFKCPTYAEHGSCGCEDIKMRQADLDQAVFTFIKKQMDVFLDMEDSIKRILAAKKKQKAQNSHQNVQRELQQRLESKRSLFSGLYVDLKDGLLSQEEYQHHRAVLKEDIAALENSLEELMVTKEETDKLITDEMKWKFLVRRYYEATELSTEMVEAFVESITIEKDSVLAIKLHYMDEFEKLQTASKKYSRGGGIVQQVGVYMRLSDEDTDKRTGKMKDVSNSIISQRLLITQYLDIQPDLRNLPRKEFCDDGFSGTNFDRPAFQQMIELARRGQISCIVVKDLSRFGRDYIEVGDYLEHIFPFLGIRFVSINDSYDSIHHKGETIGMHLAFKNLIYDYYSKDLSKKVKSAMGLRQRKAEYISCVPYGYQILSGTKHQLVIDPEVSAIVYRIFMEVIAGKSCTEIARELNSEGVPTPAEHKQVKRTGSLARPQWTHQTIHNIIGNIKYTGTMVNHTRESRFIRDKNQRRVPKNEWYIRENAHEAIVSQEEYAAAMDAIQRRRKATREHHDGSDRIYFCGHCGGKLEKANGTVFACPYHRYHEDSPCQKVRWRKAALEEVLFEALKQQAQIVKINANQQKSVMKREGACEIKRMALLEGQLKAFDREKLAYYEQYHDGKLTVEEYLTVKEQLSKKYILLQEQLEDCKTRLDENRRKAEQLEEQQAVLRQFSGRSDQKLRAHLYDAIEKVLVFDEETIEIIWKFDDLTELTNPKKGVSV